MRVVLLNAQVPFVQGGAEHLADGLSCKIRDQGHDVESVRIPFSWYPPIEIPKHIVACRLLRLYEVDPPDLVIGLKFPAYVVPAPRKKLWLLHQHRQAYDLWGTSYQDIPNTLPGRRIRDMIAQADNRYLQEAEAIFAQSQTVANRLQEFNGVQADAVLFPPLPRPEMFHAGEFGDYFFFPSRLSPDKRQHIAIDAMRHVRSRFELVLAGSATSEEYERQLHTLIEDHGLSDRVKMLGWISDDEKAELMANARGAVFIPFDEDYGYVTLEAFHAHKPVLTFSDSGGPTEFVTDEVNGRVVEPDPMALADAMESLWSDGSRARELGRHAFETIRARNISWDRVLENLLS